MVSPARFGGSAAIAFILYIAGSGCGVAVIAPTPENDAGQVDAGADPDAGQPVGGIRIVRPAQDALVLETVVVDAELLNLEEAELAFVVSGEEVPRCTLAAAPFRCLVHLSPTATGAVEVEVIARWGGAEVGRAAVRLNQERHIPSACDGGTATACAVGLVDAGSAFGWEGVVYENRDGLHANLNTAPFPGVTRVENNDRATNFGTTELHQDEALAVLGNASVAYNLTGGSSSVPRYNVHLMPSWSSLLRSNKYFFWPEHYDHGHEDYFHYANAGIGVSQGSSGTELDELRKLMAALGALRPEARQSLQANGALWPALIYANLRSRQESDAAYLTPQAHANALANAANDVSLVELVHGFTADRLPPLARLRVLTEDFGSQERNITVPEAVARVWLTDATAHTLRVDASESQDLAGRALTWHWIVLRGEGHVQVAPVEPQAQAVDITFTRHPEQTLFLNGADRRTHLAVVALFVHNGLYFSMPAFVTSYTAEVGRLAPGTNNLD
jgi:hypothetical protein